MSLPEKLKLLVAEDNIINQRLIVEMLTSLGHTGVVVGDGAKALKCLEKLKFDVVLMDAMMPVMDGLEAVSMIRSKEAVTGGRIPIIMATAHVEPGDAGSVGARPIFLRRARRANTQGMESVLID